VGSRCQSVPIDAGTNLFVQVVMMPTTGFFFRVLGFIVQQIIGSVGIGCQGLGAHHCPPAGF